MYQHLFTREVTFSSHNCVCVYFSAILHKKKLEIKSIGHLGTMHTGRIYCHSTVSGVNYYLNSNHMNHLAQILRPVFLRF